ncbi:MAG: GNAT family N-acetyltransferase [archaeon]
MSVRTMEMLDIKIARNEKDFKDLYTLENLANQPHIREKNRYFGVARLDDFSVGYWSGNFSGELFASAYFFVAENYQDNDFGYELKKHQLRFAKSLGCKFATSIVEPSNLNSWAIQEKCGGEEKLYAEIRYGEISCFTFDLKNLDF